MISVLIDHNIEGQAVWLWRMLSPEEWHAYGIEKFQWFHECGIAQETSDRQIYRYVQANGMLLLTANRNDDGADSLERTLDEEGTITSLPIVTFGNIRLVRFNADYRTRCAMSLAEIALDIDRFLGSRRVFIPF